MVMFNCVLKKVNARVTCSCPGHYLDQRRLKQGLYRHPWDDIAYLSPEDLQ